ncbi:hypothetical protein GCM10009557_84690 [Virgisporangium ochraceum]|uniref:Uncharacterized protein n=1 Tax=Virgisporangium ochraceum TaxID=65505 RepID=A0A8J4A4I3_9ACTN|nr:hypothetical protein Voc01_096800 [Virgisporangium ochraceum]
MSLALVVDGRRRVAVGHNPSTRETYRATLGGGAFRDGTVTTAGAPRSATTGR